MSVTSKDNQYVKEWRGLCQSSRMRRETGKFALEGARLCCDALTSALPIETVLYTAQAAQTYREEVQALMEAADRSVEIAPSLAGVMGDTAHPQGVFCTVKILDNRLLLDTINTMGRYGVLEDLQDPGNMGTVIRTAEALGLDGLILSAGCCDIYNPKVLRGSMGGVFRLRVLHTADLPGTLTDLQQRGMTAFACVVDKTATPVHMVSMKEGSLCVIGNEGNGLSAATVAACRERVTICMSGRAESLNASMAAGIVMWEMVRPADR